MSEKVYTKKHIKLISIAIGCLCFIATVTVTVINRHYERIQWENAFETACDDLTKTILSRIREDINDLYSIQAFFRGSELVTSDEFDQYTRTITDKNCIVGWVPEVKASEAERFTKSIRKYFYKDYIIQKGKFTSSSADVIMPVQYIKPYRKNLLGLDLNSVSADISGAVRKALFSAGPVTANIHSLPLEDVNGWILFLGNVANTLPDNRKKTLNGVIFGIYFADDIIDSTVQALTPRGINIQLSEEGPDGQEVVFTKHHSRLRDHPLKVISVLPVNHFEKTKKIYLGSKELVLHFNTVPAFFNRYTSSEPLLLFISGLALSVMISYLVWYQSTNAIKIEEQVAVRTKELIESQQKLASSAEFLNNILDSFPHPIFVIDKNYKIKKANKAARTGSKDFSRCCDIVRTETENFPQENCAASYVFKTGKAIEKNVEREIDGELRSLKILAAPFASGNDSQVVITVIDMTAEKKMHSKLLQSQKMEAIGQLAGGIAHDLNNVLQVINGYAELALAKLDENSKAYDDIIQIKKSGLKAAELTKSILTFGRKQPMNFQVIDLNKLISDFKKMLERAIPENISVSFIQSKKPCLVEGDANMLEQVLMNLCVNARDAMLPDGGKLLIRTERRKIDDDEFLRTNELTCNEYVILSIQDSGTGIKQEIIDKIFEPFYTTKPLGKGTGLGLSTVFGIVKQHNGTIIPRSQPGKGSVFSVYLPAADKQSSDVYDSDVKPDVFRKRDAVVLLAEDNDDVRILNMSVLKAHDFHVIQASDGTQAYEIFKVKSELIDIVILDVIMPEMSGSKLYHKLKEIKPDVPVLFLSGFAQDSVRIEELLQFKNVRFLQKPFSQKELVRNIYELLNMQ